MATSGSDKGRAGQTDGTGSTNPRDPGPGSAQIMNGNGVSYSGGKPPKAPASGGGQGERTTEGC